METLHGPTRPLLVVGGDPALDLANTVDEPGLESEFDHLGDPSTALAWAEQVGLLGATQAAALTRRAVVEPAAARADLRRLCRLRRAVQDVFGAVADGADVPEPAWEQLRRAAGEATTSARLERGGERCSPVWGLDRLGSLTHPIAYAALDLLTHGPLGRLKRCAACPWLYLDQSKNGSRRWCSMEDCGKAVKMQRYVAKRAASR